MESKARDIWTDYAKGIGIILVIIGHVGGVPSSIINLIYTFHMPLFFFLSGCVFKEHKKGKAIKATKNLFGRYIVYGIIFTFAYSLINGFPIDYKEKLHCLVYGCFDTGDPANTLWFLLVLYFTTIIVAAVQFIIRHTIRNSMNNRGIKFGIYLVFGVLFIIGLVLVKSRVNLPFRIQTSLICILFFVGGIIYKNEILVWINKLSSRILTASAIILACITLAISVFNGRVDLESDIIGNILLFMIGSISGSLMIIFLCMTLPVKLGLLSLIGRNSMVIYLFHLFPVVIIKCYVSSHFTISSLALKILSHIAAAIIITVIIMIKEKHLHEGERYIDRYQI